MKKSFQGSFAGKTLKTLNCGPMAHNNYRKDCNRRLSVVTNLTARLKNYKSLSESWYSHSIVTFLLGISPIQRFHWLFNYEKTGPTPISYRNCNIVRCFTSIYLIMIIRFERIKPLWNNIEFFIKLSLSFSEKS